jgi:hypothetical protein
MEAVLINEFIFCQKFVGEYLTRFRMTVHTRHPVWMNRLTPHLDSRLIDMAMEAYARVGHEKMSRKKNKGQPDDDHPRKKTKKKPFLLDKVDNGLFC